MAKPEPKPKDWDKAKRIAMYLKFRPRELLEFPFEQWTEKLDGSPDSDWASERDSMKSKYFEIVVEHADNNSVEFVRGGRNSLP